MWPVKALICAATLLLSVAPSQAQQLSDPTAPPRTQERVTVSQVGSTLRLQAIVWRDGQRRAQIDGTYYQVGDQFGGYEVLAIELNQVVLNQISRNERTILRLFAVVASTTPTDGSN